MRRILAMVATVVVLMAACGGDEGTGEAQETATTGAADRSTTTANDSDRSTTTADGDSEASSGGAECPLKPEMAEEVLGGTFESEVGSGAQEDGTFNCLVVNEDRSLSASAITFPVDDESFESTKADGNGEDVEGLGQAAYFAGEYLYVRITEKRQVVFSLPGFDTSNATEYKANLIELAKLVLPEVDLD